MLATVRASVGKITRLLSRLQADRQERSHALIDPIERLKDIVRAALEARAEPLSMVPPEIEAESFDAVAGHLLDNAIEASPDGSQVRVECRREALSVVIDIIDEGAGMSPEFI